MILGTNGRNIADCGTHLLTKSLGMRGTLLVKVGTFDDPSLFDNAQVLVFTVDKQSFHHVPQGVPAFERLLG